MRIQNKNKKAKERNNIKAKDLLKRLQELQKTHPHFDRLDIVVPVTTQGAGTTSSVGVITLSEGTEWQAGRLLLLTEEPLKKEAEPAYIG